MKVRLTDEQIEWLRAWPEAGMGYQRADVIFANGAELNNLIVLNGTDVEMPEEYAGQEIAFLRLCV